MTRKIIIDVCAGPDHNFGENSVVEFHFPGGKYRIKFDGNKLDINLTGDGLESMFVQPHASNVIQIGLWRRS